MKIIHEKAGIISKDRCWVAVHNEYIYVSNTFIGLIWEMLTGWKKDRNLGM